jgi:hypothetical protein
VDSQFRDLIDRLDHLSGQFDDLRGLIHKAIRLADDDPEMALTRVRKVLEYVVHDAYQRLVKKPPGSTPLEKLLQHLVSDGHLPVHLAPYTNLIRELGNAGTHRPDGNYKLLDVNVSLIQLRAILDWYFEMVRPDAATLPVSSAPSPTSVGPPRPAGSGTRVGPSVDHMAGDEGGAFSPPGSGDGCAPPPPFPARRGRPWPKIIAVAVLGVLVLGVSIITISITINSKYGETRTTVPGDSSNQVDRGGKLVEHDPSKNGRASNANKTEESSRTKPQTPSATPDRIPPAGPARLARRVGGDLWTVEGDQLIKERPGLGGVNFGDRGWTDYDFTFEARKSAGPDGLGAMFRTSEEGNYYLFWLGINNNKTHDLLRGSRSAKGASVIQSIPGSIRPREWYKVKISLRGQRIHILLDDHVLFECAEDFSQKGNVSLRFYNSAGRFRNIKVTAPDGTVLWEGPPDLPKKP